MFHFLAKIGRSPHAKSVMPLLSASLTMGYLGFQYLGHDITKNLFAAESAPGKREEISKELQSLIMTVYEDIKDDFEKPVLEQSIINFPTTPIKWFASSTLDPITMGMTESRTGLLIGLPIHYNYTKPSDVPSTIRKLKLFKSSSSKEKQDDQEQESKPEDCDSGDCNVNVVTLDKASSDWQNYVDSMILSDKAKKFSIARELCLGDSYRILATAGIILVSSFLSISLSRAAITKLALSTAHLTQRLPFYVIAGTAGVLNYSFVGDQLQRKYTEKSDLRALGVNETYREGAIEYFTKLKQRNVALRNLVEDLKFTYDEEGNIMEAFLRHKYTPISERLERAKEMASNKTT